MTSGYFPGPYGSPFDDFFARYMQGRGKVRIAGLTCGDPDWRRRPASAGTSVARTCSWGVLLLPRSERPGGSSADETTALGAAPQPPHDDIRPGQVLVWRLCLGPGALGEAHQFVVPLDDLHPVGLLGRPGVGVQRGDGRSTLTTWPAG